MSIRTGGWGILLIALVALWCAGCGGSGTDRATQENAPDETAQAEQAVADETTADEEMGGDMSEEPGAGESASGIPTVDPTLEVTTTPSGLKYIDVVVGAGASPQPGDMVQVHYTGWLRDGSKFDSSVDRGEPFAFPLGQGRVIRGWDEGVATMKIGGTRRLIIPSDLAYGPRGRPPVIPPAAELTFDVQLLGIQ